MRMRHTERLRAETHNFYPQRNLYLMNHLRSGRGGGEEAGEAQHRAAALSVADSGGRSGERRAPANGVTPSLTAAADKAMRR
jgi:hypothetical protein